MKVELKKVKIAKFGDWTPDRIIRLRFALGRLSQERFGALVGVSKISVNLWEAGRQIPGAMNRLALEELEGKEIHNDPT